MFAISWNRITAWCLIAVLVAASALGQSLHQFLGVEHELYCHCPRSDGSTSQQCHGDTECPFGDSSACDDKNANQSCAEHADCCPVCQLLAQLSCGYLVGENNVSQRLTLGYRHVLIDEPFIEQTFSLCIARGPPTLL